jgi:hypothetical protein
MRAYYRITKLETDLTAGRDRQLHREFVEKYDTGTNVTEQRISDPDAG